MEFAQTAAEADVVLAAAHPLVAKAAREWLKHTARHNVPVVVEMMEPVPNSTFGIGGVHIRIQPRGWFGEAASVAIYPPTRKGRRPSQTALYFTYHLVRGKSTWGHKPKITLRSMAFHVANFWNRPEVSA